MKQQGGLLLVALLAFTLASCSDQVVSDNQSAGGSTEKKGKTSKNEDKKVLNFVAHLKWDPNNTDPDCQNAPGTGLARFQLKSDGTMTFKLIVSRIENVTVAHIHQQAVGSLAGPPVLWLFPSTLPPTTPPTPVAGVTNGILAQGSVTSANLVGPLAGKTMDDLVAAVQSGRAYVNVHTSRCPAGEIQGPVELKNDHDNGDEHGNHSDNDDDGDDHDRHGRGEG